jgi:Uncharacterized protein affecting Mg2+/Co2+ transport
MEETITEGIQVQVESFYLDAHSNPENNRYVFAYHIKKKKPQPTKGPTLCDVIGLSLTAGVR